MRRSVVVEADRAGTAESASRAVGRGRRPRAWRSLLVVLLALHGLIHTLGFAASWQLGRANAIAPAPMLPPWLPAGSAPVLALGVLWLAAAVAFGVAAAGLAYYAAWWRAMAGAAAVLSLALCAAWWHDAWFGAIVDVAIVAGLLVAGRAARMKGV